MDKQGNSVEKKTLMNSCNHLRNRLHELYELGQLSQDLVDKMLRVEEKKNKIADVSKPPIEPTEQLDIVDVFNKEINRLPEIIHKIRQNIDTVANMID